METGIIQTFKSTIERLDAACDEGVVAQLDFSATPKDQQGQLFREIVVDYPLAQAVEDGIVKTPLIGEIGGPVEVPATNAADRYRQWIETPPASTMGPSATRGAGTTVTPATRSAVTTSRTTRPTA